MKPSKTKIYAYASEPLVTKGYFKCSLETPYKITVQKCYTVNKDKVGIILGLETPNDLNNIKIPDLHKFLNECESCENIKLQNLSEIIFDGCQSCENRTKKKVDNGCQSFENCTKKKVYKNIIPEIYKGSDKKHKNKDSMKLPNMENVKSEFRQKLRNLLTEFKDIFEGNGKLKDSKCKLYVDESVQPIV